MAELHLVDLDQPRPGYRRFISTWVHHGSGSTYLVDPGPASTVPHLLERLAELGVEQLDLVLLTHIHLDHGGGTAEVLDAFPEARVFCHRRGVPHLVDPSRLWRGSVQVLGDVAQLYGPPAAVAPERLASCGQLERHGIEVLPTPGHASHHLCFLHQGRLFAGEALGTTLSLPSGSPYLRQAAPPPFRPDTYLASIDLLAALDPEPQLTLFAHHGSAAGCSSWARRARSQLQGWVSWISSRGLDDRERFVDLVLDQDPWCGGELHAELDDDIQARERHFLGNAFDGIASALAARSRSTSR